MQAVIYLIAIFATYISGCNAPKVRHGQQGRVSKVLEGAPSVVLGLNDVSVLFPYVERLDLYERSPRLGALGPDNKRAFLPEDTLQALQAELKKDENLRINEGFAYGGISSQTSFEETFFQEIPEQYKLVSFRVDPCANLMSESLEQTDIESRCLAEFRLVWQSMELRDSDIHAHDRSLHLIYHLEQGEFEKLVGSLRGIKQRLDPEGIISPVNAPLGPNPLMLADTTAEEAIDAYFEIVKTFAKSSHISSIAAFGDTAPNMAGHWPMLMLDRSAEGGWVGKPLNAVAVSEEVKKGRKPIFLDDGGVEMQTVSVKESPKSVQRIEGAMGRLSEPTPVGLVDEAFKAWFKSGEEKSYLESLQQRANPQFHSFETLDCASCHTIDQDKEALFALAPELSDEALPQLSFSLSSWNLEKVYNTPSATSLQMFSLFLGEYSVRQRVINESAIVAERIRKFY